MYLRIFLLILMFLLESCKDSSNIPAQDKEIIEIDHNGKKIEIPFTFRANRQSNSDRTWREITTKDIVEFGGIQDSIIYRPTIIRADESGNIYILDIGDHSVKKFGSNGDFIVKYGSYGKGPGEFITPHRFDIGIDGKIAVIDPNLKKCVIFNDQNINEYKLNYSPLHISFLSKTEVALLQIINPIDNSIIQKLNIMNSEITDYEHIINVPEFTTEFGIYPFLNGEIYTNDRSLVYIPEMLNFFISFSKEGSIKHVNNTIDPLGKIKNKTKNATNKKGEEVVAYSFDFNAEQYVNKRMNVVNNELFITSNKASRESGYYVIDIYSLESGEYKYSIKLKSIKQTSDIYFCKNLFYVVLPSTIIKVVSYNIEI